MDLTHRSARVQPVRAGSPFHFPASLVPFCMGLQAGPINSIR